MSRTIHGSSNMYSQNTFHNSNSNGFQTQNVFLDQDKLQKYLQKTLQSQDSYNLFQSKTYLNRRDPMASTEVDRNVW